MGERKTVWGKMNYRQFMCGSAGLGIGKYFLVQWCLSGRGAVMSSYNIQPSIRMSRTVVEMSHSVLQTAVHVHMQRVELCWVKRTGTLNVELRGHNTWYF
jgi:hypothetical protein